MLLGVGTKNLGPLAAVRVCPPRTAYRVVRLAGHTGLPRRPTSRADRSRLPRTLVRSPAAKRPAPCSLRRALRASGACGALGFVFGLFDEIVPYDELTHAFTTFSVSLTFYFLFYKGAVPESRAVALGTSVFTLGVTVGAYWEIFEWFFIGKYTMADTISDLLVDSGGALAAALVALALRRSGDRLT